MPDDTDVNTNVWNVKNEEELRYNFPDKYGRECTKRTCSSEGYQILNEYGECEECGINTFPGTVARLCTQNLCSGFEVLTAEGVCEECSDAYTYPSQYDGRSCLT